MCNLWMNVVYYKSYIKLFDLRIIWYKRKKKENEEIDTKMRKLIKVKNKQKEIIILIFLDIALVCSPSFDKKYTLLKQSIPKSTICWLLLLLVPTHLDNAFQLLNMFDNILSMGSMLIPLRKNKLSIDLDVMERNDGSNNNSFPNRAVLFGCAVRTYSPNMLCA